MSAQDEVEVVRRLKSAWVVHQSSIAGDWWLRTDGRETGELAWAGLFTEAGARKLQAHGFTAKRFADALADCPDGSLGRVLHGALELAEDPLAVTVEPNAEDPQRFDMKIRGPADMILGLPSEPPPIEQPGRSDSALWDAVNAVRSTKPIEPPPPALPWATERPPVQQDPSGLILSPIVVLWPSGDSSRDQAALAALSFQHVMMSASRALEHFELALKRGAKAGRIYIVTGRRGMAPVMIMWGEQWDGACFLLKAWCGESWESIGSRPSSLEPWCPEAIAWARRELEELLTAVIRGDRPVTGE